MTRHNERGDAQDARAILMQGSQVCRQRVFGRAGGRPPEMGEGHNALRRPHQRGNILRRMSRRLDQANGGREFIALRRSPLPAITLITCNG